MALPDPGPIHSTTFCSKFKPTWSHAAQHTAAAHPNGHFPPSISVPFLIHESTVISIDKEC